MTPCTHCDNPLVAHEVGTPQICGDCWDKLAPSGRAARWEASKTIRLLQELNIQIEHQKRDERVIAQLAKSIENLNRIAKSLAIDADTLVGLFEQIIKVLREEGDSDEDDGEAWKR